MLKLEWQGHARPRWSSAKVFTDINQKHNTNPVYWMQINKDATGYRLCIWGNAKYTKTYTSRKLAAASAEAFIQDEYGRLILAEVKKASSYLQDLLCKL